MISAYARAGDIYRFYEINPAVPEITSTYFQYLPMCKAICDIALGDARLSLEREEPQAFDLLAIDAFSSDAIPIHMLTREAFALYWRIWSRTAFGRPRQQSALDPPHHPGPLRPMETARLIDS
jgi:hypothetical protein